MNNTRDPLEKEEYRVGCWNGKIEDRQAAIDHDSQEKGVVIDVEELYDLCNLIVVLIEKNKILAGRCTEEEVEQFKRLVRNLEA